MEAVDDLVEGEPPTIDPYEVLGLDRTATGDQVKSAYRKLALKNHPGMKATVSVSCNRGIVLSNGIITRQTRFPNRRKEKHTKSSNLLPSHTPYFQILYDVSDTTRRARPRNPLLTQMVSAGRISTENNSATPYPMMRSRSLRHSTRVPTRNAMTFSPLTRNTRVIWTQSTKP